MAQLRGHRFAILRTIATLALLLVALSSGCAWRRNLGTPLPRVLPPGSTLDQILDVLNRNAGSVQTLISNNGTMSVSGYPPIHANLIYQRERMLRLRGDFMGPMVDIGSNQDVFWFWVRQNTPPALYFARHDLFAASGARQVLPVEPDWLTKAIGIVTFDATEQHSGPFPSGAGRLEIRSRKLGVASPQERRTIIDETRGIILEQHMYNASGLVASAKLSDHYRTTSGTVLPRKVEITLPAPTNLTMTLSLGDIAVNAPIPNPQELFAMPNYPGYPDVDLTSQQVLQPPPAGPPPVAGSLPPAGPLPPITVPTAPSGYLPAQ